VFLTQPLIISIAKVRRSTTITAGKREATNFYVWDSEEAAKAFFHR
jgi:hypothetical protein